MIQNVTNDREEKKRKQTQQFAKERQQREKDRQLRDEQEKLNKKITELKKAEATKKFNEQYELDQLHLTWNQLSYKNKYIDKQKLSKEVKYFSNIIYFNNDEALKALIYLEYKKTYGSKSNGAYITYEDHIYIRDTNGIETLFRDILCVEINNYTYYKYIQPNVVNNIIDEYMVDTMINTSRGK